MPRPLSGCHEKSRDQHSGQNGAGGYQTTPQALHCGMTNRPSLSPSQYGRFSDETAGRGLAYRLPSDMTPSAVIFGK